MKALYVVGGVPTWNGSDCRELASDARWPSRCASCSARPSSALILCLTLAENEFGSSGSLCRKRSASSARDSRGESSSCSTERSSGRRGISGDEVSDSSPTVLKPVWVRLRARGRKSSSSSWVGGSTGALRSTTGETLVSESWEWAE